MVPPGRAAARVGETAQTRFRGLDQARQVSIPEDIAMTWTKPEFEVVDVTMEVTAYVARR